MSESQENAQVSNLEAAAHEAARLENMSPEERSAWFESQSKPPYTPANAGLVVDMSNLARAQGIFIKAQTMFLTQPHKFGTIEYTDELSKYSKAQMHYVDALQLALHQAYVI